MWIAIFTDIRTSQRCFGEAGDKLSITPSPFGVDEIGGSAYRAASKDLRAG